MGRECAICGKPIFGMRAICSRCFKLWCCDKNGSRIEIPEWVNVLIRMQKRFERQKCNFEIPLSTFLENDLIITKDIIEEID